MWSAGWLRLLREFNEVKREVTKLPESAYRRFRNCELRNFHFLINIQRG